MFKMTRTIGLSVALAATSVAGAQATTRLAVAPTSKLWIEGTSNVHDWKCEATTIDAAIDVDAAASQLATPLPRALKKVAVNVPVKSLKCGHGPMDDNMYKALQADDNAEISFIMATFEALPADSANAFIVRATGTLRVAGAENPLTMDVLATRLPEGTIKAVGTVPIKMTAFGVKPPTAIFGTIKTGDEVKVKFELTVGPRVVVATIDK